MSATIATTMVSPLQPQHASTKPCTSATCCSPSRLWKAIQSIIQNDKRDDFQLLIQDQAKISHVAHVLLTFRVSNNPLIYNTNAALEPIDQRIIKELGQVSATGLNALELALLQNRIQLSYMILKFLKQKATSPVELTQFLNYHFGNNKKRTTALHLAAFWGSSKLVQLMLDMGADPLTRNWKQLRPIDCTTHSETISILQKYQEDQEENKGKIVVTTAPAATKTGLLIAPVTIQKSQSQLQQQQYQSLRQPSLLLKKAEEKAMMIQQRRASPMQDPYLIDNNENKTIDLLKTLHHYHGSSSPPPIPAMSPLSFSSSSSSSSSFSSLSSFDYHWTPPSSPIPSSSDKTVTNVSATPTPTNITAVAPIVTCTYSTIESHREELISTERPGCIPRYDKQNKFSNVLQKPKKVRFNVKDILTDACVRGDVDTVEEFSHELQSMSEPIRNCRSVTLLQLALEKGNKKLLKILIELGEDINCTDNYGYTALHTAADLHLWKSLKFLTSISYCNLYAQTNAGKEIYECPSTPIGITRCATIIRIARKNQEL